MGLSVETAKREMSDALIDVFKLRAATFLARVERCATLQELRHVIFSILDEINGHEPEKTRALREAWDALGEA